MLHTTQSYYVCTPSGSANNTAVFFVMESAPSQLAAPTC